MSRVAVVTGASSGIGEATGRALAADGYRVALLAHRTDRIQVLADELGDAIAIEADVTDRDSILAAADRVQQDLGGADILINNAGVMLTAPFGSDQRAEHRRMVETNLLGTMTATEVFLDQLRANGRGDLVNVSSVAGRSDGRDGISAQDIAEVIAFAVSRPQRVTLNEILVRPPRRRCSGASFTRYRFVAEPIAPAAPRG